MNAIRHPTAEVSWTDVKTEGFNGYSDWQKWKIQVPGHQETGQLLVFWGDSTDTYNSFADTSNYSRAAFASEDRDLSEENKKALGVNAKLETTFGGHKILKSLIREPSVSFCPAIPLTHRNI